MHKFLSDHTRTILPYTSGGGYGGSPYGRRRGLFSSQNTVINVLAVLFLASLGFAVYSHVRASAANTVKAALTRELSDAHKELHTVKARAARGANEVDQIRMTYEHTQRRLSEVTSQLQRKEAELISKEQALKQHIQERGVVDQHRSGREAELSKMVEDLRQEILRTDNVVDALDKKIAQMEEKHAARENDWHVLAQTWVKYEQDLHEQYKRCTDEVSKLRNLTVTVNDTGTVPEAEPKLRPETDFHHIGVEVPVHQAHHFDPLPQTPPPPSPAVPSSGAGTAADLPLPEPKIRDSIIQMTDGKVGLPTDPHQQQPAGQAAPSPVQSHHHDVYHGDFHDPHPDEHWQGHYDQYHGHYDSYDPMDQYWLRDSHGDWNADDAAGANDHGDHHHAGDDVGARDQNPHHGQNAHHEQHGQNAHHEQHGQNVHHAQHDQHQGDKAAYQQHYPDHTVHKPTTTDPNLHEHAGQAHPEAHQAHPGDHWQPPQPMHGNDHHQQQHGGAAQQHHVPPTMPGMGMEHHAHHTHVQHPPNTWDHHEQHNQQQYQQQQQQYQQQQQQYQEQQQQYQQHQQQYQQQHPAQHQQQQQHIQHSGHYEGHQQQHHPTGDLAYKMGW